MSADEATTSPLKLPGLFARFVKFEHSIFALPFAYAGAFLATQQIPSFAKMFWITVVMVAARSLAMGLNRVIDHEIDARNPRTAGREIPAGTLTLAQGIGFCGLSLAVLAVSLYQLPRLTWYLSPIVVAAFVIYPYTKRFTSLCHVFLGATIGLAPVGAWVAVTGQLPWQPFLLMGVVTFWIGGFDIIYACLDLDFDRREGIHSLPVSLGVARALLVTRVFHMISAVLMMEVGLVLDLGLIYYIGVGVVTWLLSYENAIVSAKDLSRVNTAFMTMNGVISVVYVAFVTADVLVK
ncbi:MAG: UbiA-like polyprenyltransferase [Thermoleophilia bacterium]|nr:UbiA-like polyprenyltransferase [Thermoleophilia bacterium]